MFRFIKYLKFRRTGRTPEWQAAYDCLCDTTDFLYLRGKELKSFRWITSGLSLCCAAFWWMASHPLFTSGYMITLAVLFTLVSACYLLTVYSYIPMEIEVTAIYSRTAATRKPSSVVRKRIREHGVEFTHRYYIYTTESRKKAVDMTDRILGIDQEYQESETVFCFTGISQSYHYVLPRTVPDSTGT